MQEWVSTIRSKLREMKILSPRENLYSKMPEIRQPLLPTRDPTSPLPAPPPVPAAVVPGIEPTVSIVPATEIPPRQEDEPIQQPAMSNTRTQHLINLLSDPLVSLTNHLSAQDGVLPYHHHHQSIGSSASSSVAQERVSPEEFRPLLIPRPQTTKPSVPADTANDTSLVPENITIIQVSDSQGQLPAQASSSMADNQTFTANIEVNCEPTTQTVRVTTSSPITHYDEIRNLETGVTNISVGATPIATAPVPQPPSSPSNYEHVFVGDTPSQPQPYSRSASHLEQTAARHERPPAGTAAALEEVANVVVGRSSRRRRVANAAPPPVVTAGRRRSSSSSGDHRNGAGVASPSADQSRVRPVDGPRVSLREQQVLQMRREIGHPGGVRLQLRRKDCVGGIALVDGFNAVWVAGWKQKEHPMLYNALHIGDRLLSVAGMAATSAAEVNKILRASQSACIEIIIKRVPTARVYAIKRGEGECLGLIRESSSSPTIVDIIPNGLAARHGLPAKAKACDGVSSTFWVLTEINGRPVNLFFKDNEVQDRLNAVGRDISILVQPLDLVCKLRKELRLVRGYKDFLVQ